MIWYLPQRRDETKRAQFYRGEDYVRGPGGGRWRRRECKISTILLIRQVDDFTIRQLLLFMGCDRRDNGVKRMEKC